MNENIEIKGKISLKELRGLMGMNQKKFAEFVEIPTTSYRRYEENSGSAGFAEILRICEKTGIGVEKIKI